MIEKEKSLENMSLGELFEAGLDAAVKCSVSSVDGLGDRNSIWDKYKKKIAKIKEELEKREENYTSYHGPKRLT